MATDAKELDGWAMLKMGCVGALGAIPGTIGAHPCDVMKIRMQTTNSGTYREAVKAIAGISYENGKMQGKPSGMLNFYRGLPPAIEQRIVARGPMFLVSELCTQLVERYTGLKDVSARWAGSVWSGYTVGALAGLAEYRKKLLSQNVISVKEARWDNLYKTAVQAGERRALFSRLHSAGVCAALYDSTFFSTQHYLQHTCGYGAVPSYASAAASAVCVGFLFDTTVARIMIVPPNKPVDGFFRSLALLIWNAAPKEPSTVTRILKGVRMGYRGLPARVLEFSVSYGITGAVSVPVIAAFGLS